MSDGCGATCVSELAETNAGGTRDGRGVGERVSSTNRSTAASATKAAPGRAACATSGANAGNTAAARLATTARTTPVLLFHAGAPIQRIEALRQPGLNVIETPASGAGRVDVGAVARKLGDLGYSNVLIEGGGQIAAAFLRAGLIDRITSYRAGLVLGEDSRSAVGALALDRLDFAPRFSLVSSRIVGADTLETWHRRT